MAYNFFPQFNPFNSGFNSQIQQYQQPVMQQQPQILRVQSEEQARQYPVSVGNSVTFIDENKPYCYTKSMGFSQLEPPIFEKYKLVKEEPTESNENAPNLSASSGSIDLSAYATKAEIAALNERYDKLNAELEKLRDKEMILSEPLDKE